MKTLSYQKQKIIILISFLFVPVMLMIVFSYFPAIKLLQLSFTDWDGMSRDIRFIGFDNYIDVFKDPEILKTFQNNFAYLAISLIQLTISLYFAIIIDGRIRGKNLFKSVLFLPYILNGIAIAFMFGYMYSFEKGPLNLFLNYIGLGRYAVHWLSKSYFSNFSLGLISMWRFTGFTTVIFIGALQSISADLYEAAGIDGATLLQKIKCITIPEMKTVIELNIFLSISGSLSVWFEPYIITGGGPGGRTDTFVTEILQIAFKFQNYGKASAMGVLLLTLVLILVSVPRKIINIRG